MRRLLSAMLVVWLVLACARCGNVFFRGVINSGPSSVSGMVSVVQLTIEDGDVQVTFVTFLSNGDSSTVGFCGDQRSRFPLNQNLRANFNPGQPCADIVTVIVI